MSNGTWIPEVVSRVEPEALDYYPARDRDSSARLLVHRPQAAMAHSRRPDRRPRLVHGPHPDADADVLGDGGAPARSRQNQSRPGRHDPGLLERIHRVLSHAGARPSEPRPRRARREAAPALGASVLHAAARSSSPPTRISRTSPERSSACSRSGKSGTRS